MNNRDRSHDSRKTIHSVPEAADKTSSDLVRGGQRKTFMGTRAIVCLHKTAVPVWQVNVKVDWTKMAPLCSCRCGKIGN